MHSFTDQGGREWPVVIDATTVRNIKTRTDVDLTDRKSLVYVLNDPIQLCDVLYAVCESTAKERKVSLDDFGRLFRGDLIQDAGDALLEELIEFCPNAGARKSLHEVVAKAKDYRERAIRETERVIAAIDIDAEVEKTVAKFREAIAQK